MSIDMGPSSGLAFPKSEPRIKTKRREDRAHAKSVSGVRQYVFARDRNLCRCCRIRPAESMHELKPRSLGGKVSRKNSVALCGDGVHGCHGLLQRHEIAVGASVFGAEAELIFTAMTELAAEWLRIQVGQQIRSEPMVAMEQAE